MPVQPGFNILCFTDELLELIEALNRSHSAIQEACKVTLAHEEKSRMKEPVENPTAKANVMPPAWPVPSEKMTMFFDMTDCLLG